jgi:hypothetical protein
MFEVYYSKISILMKIPNINFIFKMSAKFRWMETYMYMYLTPACFFFGNKLQN